MGSPANDVTFDELEQVYSKGELLEKVVRKGTRGKVAFIAQLERDIDEGVREVEANAQHYQESNEDTISRQLVTFLRGCGYDASSDPNDRGHVDLHVVCKKINLRWFGEAKIHDGKDHDLEGIKQLVTRYANGADAHGGFFLYVLEANAKLITERWRENLANDPDSKMTNIEDGETPWRFRSSHDHDSGIVYTVRHHIVLMHHSPKDKSAKASAARAGEAATRPPSA